MSDSPTPATKTTTTPETKTAATEEIYPFLRYHLTTGTGQRQDAGAYLLNFKVEILAEYGPDDDDDDNDDNDDDDDNDPLATAAAREIHLGDLRATLIRVGRACEEGFPLFDLFDHSAEIHALGSALFDFNYYDEFAEPIERAFPNALPNPDILYLRGLTLRSFAQGQRAGISALHRFLTDWESGCSLVALQPRPLQFEPGIRGSAAWEDLQLGRFPQDRGEATAKLERHFAGLGFEKIDGVGIAGDDGSFLPYQLLCPALRQAPLEEMALEDRLVLPRAGI